MVVALQTAAAPPPNQGIADTLEEAKARLTARHEEIERAGRRVLISALG
jgi:hypothetical protein